MSPDKIKIAEVIHDEQPSLPMTVCESVAEKLITAGATLSETAEWRMPIKSTQSRPYCTRCGEDALFDGWGFPKWSVRCPNCGAIMSNAKEK